jgi:hypothetical protein
LALTGQSALADASYMVSAPAKALIPSSVSDQKWKNLQTFTPPNGWIFRRR